MSVSCYARSWHCWDWERSWRSAIGTSRRPLWPLEYLIFLAGLAAPYWALVEIVRSA